jgi:hypothetical protein
MLPAAADASKASGLCLAMPNSCVSPRVDGTIGSFKWDASVRVIVEEGMMQLLS